MQVSKCLVLSQEERWGGGGEGRRTCFGPQAFYLHFVAKGSDLTYLSIYLFIQGVLGYINTSIEKRFLWFV